MTLQHLPLQIAAKVYKAAAKLPNESARFEKLPAKLREKLMPFQVRGGLPGLRLSRVYLYVIHYALTVITTAQLLGSSDNIAKHSSWVIIGIFCSQVAWSCVRAMFLCRAGRRYQVCAEERRALTHCRRNGPGQDRTGTLQAEKGTCMWLPLTKQLLTYTQMLAKSSVEQDVSERAHASHAMQAIVCAVVCSLR